ncbi:MAG: arginine--tRNA ligase [Prolixibacteraceae bacterium]|nr:arginine--tRNA ligase [Prolixibacteraceae bacterium]
MNLEIYLQDKTVAGIEEIFGFKPEASQIQLQQIKREYEGDITLVVFPLVRMTKKSPEETAVLIGEYLAAHVDEVESYNVIKGFLNISICNKWWISVLKNAFDTEDFGIRKADANSELVMIEYSSPNTNKPLHLGHIRNNLLGYSLAEILKNRGKKVVKTNIVNDRGIHICKSMYAWQQWGEGKTPGNTGLKGDHLVGDFYVMFNEKYKKEIAKLEASGMTKEEAENQAQSILGARELLRKWEVGDKETVDLWKMMNSWVYEGFDVTYKELGVDFDKIYYESETYLEGKNEVLRGIREGIFHQHEDSSVWADLTSEGLDQKLLLRSDGTSVYMTQDIGTAKMRFNDYPIDKMIYVVGNEQDYHFQVLSILLDKLGYEWGKGLYHFSYGMVELPSGKIKSREGTVVDADDLMENMTDTARKIGAELGKLQGLTPEEMDRTYKIIALGALKYFILKVDPKKNMMFNPLESIDFNGNTGPFIQYTYARIKSVLRKAAENNTIVTSNVSDDLPLLPKEKEILKAISQFPVVVEQAGNEYSPAVVANYCYELTKLFNQFYHDYTILNESNESVRGFRILLSSVVAEILNTGMGMLGIEMPERM